MFGFKVEFWGSAQQQQKQSTSGHVSNLSGDYLRAGKPSPDVTNHPGQLSLAIPQWVGAMSSSL